MAEIIERLTPHLADRYRLLRVAARGGTSVIIYAEDVRHDRPVAIKVFSGEFSALAGADRFIREIGILARLQHPNILPLIDSGTADGLLYYVMPFVQGESLRQRLVRDGAMPVQDALRLLREICDALRYAHEQGLVHRDIKPENILIASRHALVADFGVARATRASSDTTHTTAGIAIGTPAYMAPEQAAADPLTDHRADIYALGVLAYEMLAGRPPFEGDQPARVLAAHVTQPPPPLTGHRPDLPPGLDDVIMRCLAKRPGDRYDTAEALGDALEPFLLSSGALTPVGTRPVTRATQRRRLLLGALGVAVLAVGAILLSNRGGGPGLRVGDPRRLGVSGELELDPALSPDGSMLAYAAGINGRMRITVRLIAGSNPTVIAPDVEPNQRWPRWLPDGRIAFQAGPSVYAAPALGGQPEALVEGTGRTPVAGFDLSPDGARLAYFSEGVLRVRALDGSGAPTDLVRDDQGHSPAWSPDGRWLAYARGNADFVFSETLLGNIAPARLMLVPAAGGDPIPLTDGRTLAVSPAWADHRTLVYVQGHAAIRDVHSLRVSGRGRPDGAPVRLTTGLNPHGVRLTADRGAMVYSVLAHESNVWGVVLPARGEVSIQDAERITAGQQLIEDMDLLPGGGYMLFDSNVDGSQDIWLMMNLASGQAIQLTRDSTEEFGPAWSPDGKEIAYYAIRDGVRQVFVMRNTGKAARQVTVDSLQSHQPRWSPDGLHLVFNRTTGPGQSHIFVVDRNADSSWTAPRQVGGDPGAGANWSPDGRWIAFADPEGRIRLVRPEGGASRVVAGPEQTGGLRLRRPLWLIGEPALLARAEAPGGQGGIWRVPIDGGEPRELVRFDDPARPVYRDDFASDGERVLFTVSEISSGLWTAPLLRP